MFLVSLYVATGETEKNLLKINKFFSVSFLFLSFKKYLEVQHGTILYVNVQIWYKETEYVPVEYPSTTEILADLHKLEMEITKGLAALEEMV